MLSAALLDDWPGNAPFRLSRFTHPTQLDGASTGLLALGPALLGGSGGSSLDFADIDWDELKALVIKWGGSDELVPFVKATFDGIFKPGWREAFFDIATAWGRPEIGRAFRQSLATLGDEATIAIVMAARRGLADARLQPEDVAAGLIALGEMTSKLGKDSAFVSSLKNAPDMAGDPLAAMGRLTHHLGSSARVVPPELAGALAEAASKGLMTSVGQLKLLTESLATVGDRLAYKSDLIPILTTLRASISVNDFFKGRVYQIQTIARLFPEGSSIKILQDQWVRVPGKKGRQLKTDIDIFDAINQIAYEVKYGAKSASNQKLLEKFQKLAHAGTPVHLVTTDAAYNQKVIGLVKKWIQNDELPQDFRFFTNQIDDLWGLW